MTGLLIILTWRFLLYRSSAPGSYSPATWLQNGVGDKTFWLQNAGGDSTFWLQNAGGDRTFWFQNVGGDSTFKEWAGLFEHQRENHFFS